jgi:two-component system sensor histidine kinase DesK
MHKWCQIFQRNTGLSPYVWVVFYILPFYFIFSATSTFRVVFGIVMIIVFFACYVLSFISNGWLVGLLLDSVQIVILIAMTLLFGYVYFSLSLAFFIGNIQNRTFITLYTIHLVTTFAGLTMDLLHKHWYSLLSFPSSSFA